MYNTMMAHECQRSKHLRGESSDQCCRKSSKAVRLDQLVQVDTEQLHGDTQMVSEIKVFSHLDDIVLLIGILDDDI